MRRFRVIAALSLLALFASSASAQEFKNSLRFGGYYVGPTGTFFEEVTGDDDDTALFFEGDQTEALFVSYERILNERYGLEVTLSQYGLDVDGYFELSSRNDGDILRSEFRAKTDVTPLTVGINRYFGSSEVWDFYIGAFVSYVLIEDLEFSDVERTFLQPGFPELEDPFSVGDTISAKNDLGWGALVGLDLRLGESKKWFLTSAVRYTRTAIESGDDGADNSEIDIDPWLFQLGVGVSF